MFQLCYDVFNAAFRLIKGLPGSKASFTNFKTPQGIFTADGKQCCLKQGGGVIKIMSINNYHLHRNLVALELSF